MDNLRFETVWQRLEQAAAARSPFNFLQLATLGLDGAPQLRTVVLRRCPAPGLLSFVTDSRSPKIAEIRRDPRVSMVGYDPDGQVQIRLSGTAGIVADEAARLAFWQGLRGRTRALFDAPLTPGTPVDLHGMPLDGSIDDPVHTAPYDRFALVDVAVTRLEWLDLAAQPHQRIAFSHSGDGWAGQRIAP